MPPFFFLISATIITLSQPYFFVKPLFAYLRIFSHIHYLYVANLRFICYYT
nr:MAG TPA: hypothetical protein [Caudoviricetes sp.]